MKTTNESNGIKPLKKLYKKFKNDDDFLDSLTVDFIKKENISEEDFVEFCCDYDLVPFSELKKLLKRLYDNDNENKRISKKPKNIMETNQTTNNSVLIFFEQELKNVQNKIDNVGYDVSKLTKLLKDKETIQNTIKYLKQQNY